MIGRSSMLGGTTRLFLVDGHPIVRLGLRHLFESTGRYEVVGEASTVREAAMQMRDAEASVCLLDLVLEDGSGLELLRQLQDSCPDTRVVVLSMLDEAIYAERCVRAGAFGYVQKTEDPDALMSAVEIVLNGDVYLGQSATQRLMRRVAAGASAHSNPIHELTDRELEVLMLLGQGHRTSEIASHLHLSPKTVESHQAKLRRKLGARNGADLLRIAMSWHEGAGHLAS